MKKLFNNKWFQYASVTVGVWTTLAIPGLGGVLWFAYFVLWVLVGDKTK